MTKGNSAVEVAFVQDQDSPTLKILALDPDGIKEIHIWSRHGRVPTTRTYDCPKRVEDTISPYPKDWFPVTVDVKDCQTTPATDRHGPYDQYGDDADGTVEFDETKPPGPFEEFPPEPPQFDWDDWFDDDDAEEVMLMGGTIIT